MADDERATMFDDWAATYDDAVAQADGFPFAGYDEVLAAVVTAAGVGRGTAVLDLGCGTGALSRLLVDHGAAVLGTDFSPQMIERARAAVPEAAFIQLDLLDDWAALDGRRFARIVSTYVFHEFDLRTKVRLVTALARQHLAPGGAIVIGDIAFATAPELEQERARSGSRWDPAEHYWIADAALATLAEAGTRGSFRPVSICAGVFVLHPAEDR